ncbi:hypothetical protein N7510_009069 [Penicillium lagena]|uniref:uncharacterized protein n=1 Tax=Penicillium lagena TaxID=94218 RepID=UPI00253FC486|nr:uncharacterized protein N7510_009069 [Penicillium lagena]KAJ5606288.1 hypothetical protein N7510_009069 [Penicillium lagena]
MRGVARRKRGWRGRDEGGVRTGTERRGDKQRRRERDENIMLRESGSGSEGPGHDPAMISRSGPGMSGAIGRYGKTAVEAERTRKEQIAEADYIASALGCADRVRERQSKWVGRGESTDGREGEGEVQTKRGVGGAGINTIRQYLVVSVQPTPYDGRRTLIS